MSKEIISAALLVIFLCSVYGGPSDPEPRPDQWWMDRHAQYVNNTASNPNIPILFFGDSITEGWTYAQGSSVFNQYYAPLGVVNYGLRGDRTEHVLWRILHGEVQGLNPRLVVLKIGTNNIPFTSTAGAGVNSNSEIADGVSTIVSSLRQLLPNTKILLLGILPRSITNPEYSYRSIIEINSMIQNFHDGVNVFFLDMFASFSESWGVVPDSLFYDRIHLTTAGYQKWADVMNPLFNLLIA